MAILISFLPILLAHCLTTSAFNIEDVAVFLPLLRNVQTRSCPPNELWSTCTANCSDCARRGSCVVTECQSGCDCVPRYFRIEPDGPCVPVANCPRPECGEGEVFRECGPVCERCGAQRCRLISCDHRCYCRQGRRRNEEGVCVPPHHCPPPHRSGCSHNEEWSEVGRSDEWCLREEEVEEASNGTRNVPGCYCKEGYHRNTFGSCVTSCAHVKCLGVNVYRKCVPQCNVTCRSEAGCEEDGDCHPGCFCPSGYAMNDFNNCIPREDCSTDIPEVKIVRGSGIMVEEPETTPGGDTTTTDRPETSETENLGRQTEDVGRTETTVHSQTEATTSGPQEDLADQDI